MCIVWPRLCVCVIKLIVVFIYIRWHTNELSSCATSFPLCKHHIRVAVNVKRTNNVINVSSDGGLYLSLSLFCLKMSWDMIIDIRLLLLLVSDNDKWVKEARERERGRSANRLCAYIQKKEACVIIVRRHKHIDIKERNLMRNVAWGIGFLLFFFVVILTKNYHYKERSSFFQLYCLEYSCLSSDRG
jgi:hypothetical protein